MLRTLSPAATRHRATRRLMTKYADGRRGAADVVEGLAALLAQLHYDEASRALNDALHSVRPVPSLLWDFACAQLEWLSHDTLRQMLRLAAADRRLARRFEAHRGRLAGSVNGILALLQEGGQLEWSGRVLCQALRGPFEVCGSAMVVVDRGPDHGSWPDPLPSAAG